MPPERTKNKRRQFPRHTEETEQQQFINWVKREFPHVIIYADYAAGLNLEMLGKTHRERMMAMRSRKGMPDVYVDFPSRGYHGARFEFKKTGTAIYKKDGVTLRKAAYVREYVRHGKKVVYVGDHLQEQAATLREYNELGYFARFAKGLDHGKMLFNWYMEIPLELEMQF